VREALELSLELKDVPGLVDIVGKAAAINGLDNVGWVRILLVHSCPLYSHLSLPGYCRLEQPIFVLYLYLDLCHVDLRSSASCVFYNNYRTTWRIDQPSPIPSRCVLRSDVS